MTAKILPATSTATTSENRITRASHSTPGSQGRREAMPPSVADRLASEQRTLARPVLLPYFNFATVMRSIFLGGTSPRLEDGLRGASELAVDQLRTLEVVTGQKSEQVHERLHRQQQVKARGCNSRVVKTVRGAMAGTKTYY